MKIKIRARPSPLGQVLLEMVWLFALFLGFFLFYEVFWNRLKDGEAFYQVYHQDRRLLIYKD